VLFDGAQRWLAYSERPDRIVDWVEHLSTRPVDEPSLRELVDIVTADDHVARSVNGVRITYPAPLLQGGVVIVDTPGLNAEQTHRWPLNGPMAGWLSATARGQPLHPQTDE
jgi:hypothetical protein